MVPPMQITSAAADVDLWEPLAGCGLFRRKTGSRQDEGVWRTFPGRPGTWRAGLLR
jgi:hypothetical protein